MRFLKGPDDGFVKHLINPDDVEANMTTRDQRIVKMKRKKKTKIKK